MKPKIKRIRVEIEFERTGTHFLEIPGDDEPRIPMNNPPRIMGWLRRHIWAAIGPETYVPKDAP